VIRKDGCFGDMGAPSQTVPVMC